MMSNRFPRAPLVIRDKKKEPGFLLAVVDPRDTETAKLADIHLQAQARDRRAAFQGDDQRSCWLKDFWPGSTSPPTSTASKTDPVLV